MVRNFRQSKDFPLNPTRLWRNSTGPGEEQAVATKQKIKKGASNTIAESDKMISIIRFEVCPIGHGAVSETKRASESALFTLARLSMSQSPKIYVAIANKTAGTAIVPMCFQFFVQN
jgi:hypothetical protein